MSKDTSFHHDCGKGSRPRPYEVSQEEFTKKFDAIDWSVKSTTSVENTNKEEKSQDD